MKSKPVQFEERIYRDVTMFHKSLAFVHEGS